MEVYKGVVSRTKTIKNVVCVNEELTADEWKRRYERERDKNMKLKHTLASMAAELMKWRQGEKVSAEEQQQPLSDLSVIANLSSAAADAASVGSAGVSPSASLMSMFSGSSLNLAGGTTSASSTDASYSRGLPGPGANDEEVTKLYAQMDEKVTPLCCLL